MNNIGKLQREYLLIYVTLSAAYTRLIEVWDLNPPIVMIVYFSFLAHIKLSLGYLTFVCFIYFRLEWIIWLFVYYFYLKLLLLFLKTLVSWVAKETRLIAYYSGGWKFGSLNCHNSDFAFFPCAICPFFVLYVFKKDKLCTFYNYFLLYFCFSCSLPLIILLKLSIKCL